MYVCVCRGYYSRAASIRYICSLFLLLSICIVYVFARNSWVSAVSTTHKHYGCQTNKENLCTLQTVALLLRHGADPNFPLGRSMGSAMCAITTHSAHRHRELGASLALVRQDLVYSPLLDYLSAMYAINSDVMIGSLESCPVEARSCIFSWFEYLSNHLC